MICAQNEGPRTTLKSLVFLAYSCYIVLLYLPGFYSFKGCFLKVFTFIDKVIEIKASESLTAHYTLMGQEEFLQDHFSGFPVMPGVLMLEALKQAATVLLTDKSGKGGYYRLVRLEDAKFGQFVKPGNTLKIFVQFLKQEASLSFFKGDIQLVNSVDGPGRRKALTARLVLAPISA